MKENHKKEYTTWLEERIARMQKTYKDNWDRIREETDIDPDEKILLESCNANLLDRLTDANQILAKYLEIYNN
jgi:hypothetical protein